VEEQSSSTLHAAPRHPYTAALLGARPDITSTAPRLRAVPGNPLSAFEAPPGCAFAPRCPFVQDRCRESFPALTPAGQGVARCVRTDELGPLDGRLMGHEAGEAR
jgi:oligopeptide/dipeptide ABC transporter ATP-binding protein